MKQIYNCSLKVLQDQEKLIKKEVFRGGPSTRTFKMLLERIKHEIEALKSLMNDEEEA